jgi:hypothetical protein
MHERDLAILEEAALWENRERVLRMRLKDGEILLARIILMPCKCGECTDDLVFYEQVWSSIPENQAKWESDRISKNVGGYAIPLNIIEGVEIEPRSERG